MRYLIIFLFCFAYTSLYGQANNDVLTIREDTTYKKKYGYIFLNSHGKTIMRLDTAKYTICFTNAFRYFAVVGFKKKHGWWAIDRNERILFEVYNTSRGEPSPDDVREGLIRTVDSKGKIGFANHRGQIVIKPQFEAATSFYKGKAIIGRDCKELLWGGDAHAHDGDKHYTIDCKQAGYINKKGQVLKVGDYSFEQIQKQIGWKSEFEIM